MTFKYKYPRETRDGRKLLFARFNFNQDIPWTHFQERKEIRRRIGDRVSPSYQFDQYLEEREDLLGWWGATWGKCTDFKGRNDDRFVRIHPHRFYLGFDIKMLAPGDYSFEQMIDLEGLNRFMLTGVIPKGQRVYYPPMSAQILEVTREELANMVSTMHLIRFGVEQQARLARNAFDLGRNAFDLGRTVSDLGRNRTEV